MANFYVWLICLIFLISELELEASHQVFRNLQTIPSSSQEQPYRTAFHFQPPKNWINDPNGPMIYKGIYHLFYQYNPEGAVWGNIVWAHSTSTDLINWTPHAPAIFPSQPADINGCWSGSATILPGGKPVMLYTGIDPNNQQVQNYAEPKNLSDPYLVEWVKSPKNPIMAPNLVNRINASSFRDPTTAWLGPDGNWRVIVGSKIDRQGKAILYKSKDFFNWVEAENPLHFSDNTGMWECPDFFPVSINSTNGLDTSIIGENVKHVVKVSLDDTKTEYYTIGNYDHEKDIYTPDEGSIDNGSGLRYDYGKYYASKTFFDDKMDQRVLLGWTNESTSPPDDVKKGWSGVHTIPRRIWLDKNGKQLIQWPVAGIEKLRTNNVEMPNKELEGGGVLEVKGVTAVQTDVEISFEITSFDKLENMDPSWSNPQLLCSQKPPSLRSEIGPFGLLVLASENLEEYTAVYFRIFKSQNKYTVLMCSDQSRSSSQLDYDKTTYGAFLDIDPTQEKLSLRSLIDHSIVESFGGEGKVCISSRVYPSLAIGSGAHLYAFNNGTQSVQISTFTAWSMGKAQIG